jgi:hypothetical protein
MLHHVCVLDIILEYFRYDGDGTRLLVRTVGYHGPSYASSPRCSVLSYNDHLASSSSYKKI